MADTPESKPPFWSSLPGIFTGLGGLIVALTGLITALYSTGMIGSKPDSNISPINTAITLVSAPAASPSPSHPPRSDANGHLAGKWQVIEERSKEFGGEKIIWAFDATVAGDELLFKGKITSVNGNDPNDADTSVRSTYRVKMMGSEGMGKFERTEKNGVTMSYPATLRLDEEPNAFHGTIDIKGQTACSLTGRKL